MPRATQVKSISVSSGWASGVLVFACLILVWSRPVFSAEEPSLGFAPINVSIGTFGFIDYLLGYRDAGAASQNLNQALGLTVGVGVRASSFIWQPWAVKVGANLNASIGSVMMDSGRNSQNMKRSNEDIYQGTAGEVYLSVLPESAMPFMASYSISDTSQENRLVKSSLGTLTDQLRLSQELKSIGGRFNFITTYINSRMESSSGLVDKAEVYDTTLSLTPFRYQKLQIHSANERDDHTQSNGEVFLRNSRIARHSFEPGATFSVATLVSNIDTGLRKDGLENGQLTKQLSTAGTWRPSNSRLTVTGGLRWYEDSYKFKSVQTPVSGYTGANLGASYAWTSWFRLYGSADVSDSNGTQNTSSTSLSNLNLAATVHDRAKTIKLGEFNYNRGVAANISNTSTATTTTGVSDSSTISTQSLSLQLHHGLDTSHRFGTGTLTSVASQSVSTSTSRTPSISTQTSVPTGKLNNNISLLWKGGADAIGIRAAYSRDIRGAKAYFQTVNLQTNHTENINITKSIAGNLTINASRNGYDAVSVPDYNSVTSSATMSYFDQKPFGVRNMLLTSSLRVMSPQLISSDQTADNQGTYSWENKLTYKIGKLAAELNVDIEEVRSSRSARVMFHVRRTF